MDTSDIFGQTHDNGNLFEKYNERRAAAGNVMSQTREEIGRMSG
jgi:hypothetical protein